MPEGGGIVMALRMTRLAGFLMFLNVQASNIADGSTNNGSESSKSFIGDKGKFMAHHLNRMEYGGRPEALSDHYGLVEDASAPFGSSHRDGKLKGGGVKAMPTVDSPFTTYSEELVHAKAYTQDTWDFSSARPGAFRTSQNFKTQKMADDKEDIDAQKLLSNESNKPVGFSAIVVAIASLSLAAMIGVRLRRRIQPAIALAGSSGHGIDMSIPLATVSADNTSDMHTDISSSLVPWDPLVLGEDAPTAHVKNFPGSELQHGQLATIAVFFVSPAAAGNVNVDDGPPRLTVGDRVRAPTRQNLFGGAPAEEASVAVQAYADKAASAIAAAVVGADASLLENEFFEADAQFEARTDALKKEYETTLKVRIDVLEQELGREKESAIRSLEEAQKLQLEEMRTYFADETAEMKLRNFSRLQPAC